MVAVHGTVSVALITSLSTLSAGALAGAVSAWATRRQLQHQRILAREERAEQWAISYREMRREAYEQFHGRFKGIRTLHPLLATICTPPPGQ